MKIEIFHRRSLTFAMRWYFRIVAKNGKILAQSEGYNTERACVETAENLRSNLHRSQIEDVS